MAVARWLRNGPLHTTMTNSITVSSDEMPLPLLFINGPFGHGAEAVFASEAAVLIADDSGITACASILKSVYYRAISLRQSHQLRKVYFFWICGMPHELEWFKSLLLALELQDVFEFLEVRSVSSIFNICIIVGSI